jgi:hypothetical protein
MINNRGSTISYTQVCNMNVPHTIGSLFNTDENRYSTPDITISDSALVR